MNRHTPRLPAGPAFWTVAVLFAVAMAFTTVPTPLWRIYQHREGFTTLTVTLAFAIYAVGVLVSLYAAGNLSDQVGRRPVLLAGLLAEVAAAIVMSLWTALPALLAARFTAGLSVGVISTTATVYLGELGAAARPDGRQRANVVATVVNMGGFALGPLISGLLAQYAAAPLRTPYLVFLVLLAAGALTCPPLPETVRRDRARRYRPQHIALPRDGRAAFLSACSAALASFALLGLFTSLAPGFVAGTLHHPSAALAGLIAFLVFAAAVAGQLPLRRGSPRTQSAAGLTALVLGLAGMTEGVWTADFAVFVTSGTVAGAGAGVLFKGAVATVAAGAAPDRRGETLAGLFLAAYLGLAAPVLGLGLAHGRVPDRDALGVFAAALAALCVAAAPGLLRMVPAPSVR